MRWKAGIDPFVEWALLPLRRGESHAMDDADCTVPLQCDVVGYTEVNHQHGYLFRFGVDGLLQLSSAPTGYADGNQEAISENRIGGSCGSVPSHPADPGCGC